MGYQTSHSTKRITQPILKAKEDSSDAHERSLIPRALNLTDHTLTNTKFIPSGYDSWVVSTTNPLKHDMVYNIFIFKISAFFGFGLNYSQATKILYDKHTSTRALIKKKSIQ